MKFSRIIGFSFAVMSLFFGACQRRKTPRSVAPTSLVTTAIEDTSTPGSGDKKKIVIFMSRGGGGHIAVSNALKRYFEPDYEVSIVNMVADVLPSLDPIRIVTFDRYNGEDLYNFFLKNRFTWCANKLCMQYGASRMLSLHREIERLTEACLKKERPDLVISVMPLVNSSISKVTQRMNLPFLLITNDLDTSNYINGFDGNFGSQFVYTLPFDDPAIRAKITKAKIPAQKLAIVGFPIRPDFFEQKNREKICSDFGIPTTKPVIMIMMGGTGSDASYRYVKQIAKMKIPLHIMVCLGRNEELGKKINKIKRNPEITMTTIGFTDRISDLMAVSHVLITKPGPGSIAEALYMQVPMLLDCTSRVLSWERLNIQFVVKNGLGECIHSYKEAPQLLLKYLNDTYYYNGIKKQMALFPQVRSSEKIRAIVADLLKESPQQRPRRRAPLPSCDCNKKRLRRALS